MFGCTTTRAVAQNETKKYLSQRGPASLLWFEKTHAARGNRRKEGIEKKKKEKRGRVTGKREK